MNLRIAWEKVSHLFAVSIFIVLFLSQAGFTQETELRSLTIDDYFELKRVSDPQVSPEGDLVAYTVTETDIKKDKRETHIWMVPTEGGDPVQMTAKGTSASRPRWSPDGKYLTFLAARNEGKTQVWALNRLGGEAQQLTTVKQGVKSYKWSPDGKQLLLVVKDAKPEDLKKNKKEKEKPKPWVIDRLQFKRDNEGYLDRRRTHLYLFTPGDTLSTQITFGDFDDVQPAWSPDGKKIAFVSNRTENPDGNDNRDIWIVLADTAKEEQPLFQLTKNEGPDTWPSWSADGRFITYVTDDQPDIIWYATNYLAVIPSKGGAPSVLTKSLDRNVSAPHFSRDGKFIYFLLEESAERHLGRISVSGKNLTRPVAGQRSVSRFSINKTGRIATLISEPKLPSEVFLLEKKKLKQLTSTNADLLKKVALADVENIHFKSKDGTDVEGFLFKPSDFKPNLRYPTLLRIHGGPVAQYDFRFNFDAQLFAANGYVVVMANPRGSSGYGQDFSLAIWQDWGNKDYDDVMAAVDFAIEKGYADPNRLGVGGWSYGGILTNYVITKTDRFKAAISGASEVLYAANYGHDHYQYEWEKELGLPWENRILWEKLSPFNSVQNIVTPTLIMGGEKDWNVPILNSEQLYQALKRLGRTTKLVVYPGEHHGFRKPSFQKDRYERYLAWYAKYVKGNSERVEKTNSNSLKK